MPFCLEFRRVDRKSTRLNSSHQIISYAVFCLKKNAATRPCNQAGERSKITPLIDQGLNASAYAGFSFPLFFSSVHFLPHHLLFFFNDTATTEIYTLSLHDALPI